MKINGNTKVSKVIKENKEAIEVIASLNSHFTKLRNPILRRLMVSRYTLEKLATEVQCETQFLLDELNKIGFEIEGKKEIYEDPKQLIIFNSRLEFIEDKMVKPLDLIPILAQSKESLFDVIENALKNLRPNEVLEAQLDLNPVFLTKLFQKTGYKALTVFNEGNYHIYFKADITKFHKINERFFIKSVNFK
jgi:hypothetical protein